MRDYSNGKWGFLVVFAYEASVFPRAVVLATPNAILTFFLATYIDKDIEEDQDDEDQLFAEATLLILVGFSSVMFFVLYFRSNIAYKRWWEGGTLLQKTRGEWFNAYSSLLAFSSTQPEMGRQVEEYRHLLVRLLALLFCLALQQVSPYTRILDILETSGIEMESMIFLNGSKDKVEVILQWIQKTIVFHMQTGVMPVAPPILSRCFQELSRGIVNLQNARKIAEFPFPFPFSQTSMVMLLLHWAAVPILCSMLLHRIAAAMTSFLVIFFIWSVNYIALELEMPFGNEANSLPMDQMQRDWVKSLKCLMDKTGREPPTFDFMRRHRRLETMRSDGNIELCTGAPSLIRGSDCDFNDICNLDLDDDSPRSPRIDSNTTETELAGRNSGRDVKTSNSTNNSSGGSTNLFRRSVNSSRSDRSQVSRQTSISGVVAQLIGRSSLTSPSLNQDDQCFPRHSVSSVYRGDFSDDELHDHDIEGEVGCEELASEMPAQEPTASLVKVGISVSSSSWQEQPRQSTLDSWSLERIDTIALESGNVEGGGGLGMAPYQSPARCLADRLLAEKLEAEEGEVEELENRVLFDSEGDDWDVGGGLDLPDKDQGEVLEYEPLYITALQHEDFEEELRTVGVRMKALHARIIDEEIELLSALGSQTFF